MLILILFVSDRPDGWELKPEFGKCYFYIDEGMNWSEANDMCAALDPDGVATLTSIRSKMENDYVQSLINYSTLIGGTDEGEEGTWW